MNNIQSPRTDDAGIEAEIQAKGLTAPRVTPADIEENISDEYYFTAGDGVTGVAAGRPVAHLKAINLLTFCVLVLRNGFTVTGESACASPENFDAEVGRKIARANAVQKIWPLMGYALRQQLHDIEHAQPPAPTTHQQRVVVEKAELDEKRTKLKAFFATPIFEALPEPERSRLLRQEDAMRSYSMILEDRIAAF